MAHFEPGTSIALREVWDGKLWAVRPMITVRDDDTLIATWMPRGTPWRRCRSLDGSPLRIPSKPWAFIDDVRWFGLDVLQLTPPGAAHAVWCSWDPDGAFHGWYVNLQQPLRRTPIGFDYMDLALDIVVAPDRNWRWKDIDDLEAMVEASLLTRAQADAVTAEGDRVIAAIEANASPFSDGWETWMPDPTWPTPTLPAGSYELHAH